MENSNHGAIKGVFVGLMAGIVAGLMLAPKSGRELREDMADKGHDYLRSMKSKFRHIKEMGEDDLHNFMDEAATKYAKLKNLTLQEKDELVARAKQSWRDAYDDE